MEVGNGTAAGKAEAARKSADTTGAATASADRRAAEADSGAACGDTVPSDQGRFCLLIQVPRSSHRNGPSAPATSEPTGRRCRQWQPPAGLRHARGRLFRQLDDRRRDRLCQTLSTSTRSGCSSTLAINKTSNCFCSATSKVYIPAMPLPFVWTTKVKARASSVDI